MEVDGTRYDAQVVSYDPNRDISILDVPNLRAEPLLLAEGVADSGSDALMLGYPGGGDFVATPVRIREVVELNGPDIYRTTTATREVYTIRGFVRQGDSGGPIIDLDGKALGSGVRRGGRRPRHRLRADREGGRSTVGEGREHCAGLWDQRDELRAEYDDVHGTDRSLWPAQHPGVVLDAVPSTAHGACQGCQWFDVQGHWMGPFRLVRASLYMAAPTPRRQWCMTRWSTSLAGRKVRPAMMTKCQAQHRVSIWRSPQP